MPRFHVEAFGCWRCTRRHNDECPWREVLKNRVEVGKEEWQVVLDAGRRDSLTHILVDRATPYIDGEGVVPMLAEQCDGGFVQGHLATRQQANFLEPLLAALGLRIEAAQGVDLIVQQIDAKGLDRAHGKHIHHRAA